MTQIVGGLRQRLIRDSVFKTIRKGIEDLGWLDEDRGHMPINFRSSPVPIEEEIPLNTCSVHPEPLQDREHELGDGIRMNTITYWVDFFAEDDTLGLHFIGDVFDILVGRFSSIGRTGPTIEVYDYRLATPMKLFSCDLEDIVQDRAHDFTKPWQKHWFVVRFDVVDAYGDEGS